MILTQEATLHKEQTAIGQDVAYAARLLQKGHVVAIPTETVYGLAANALDADAVRKIFEVKNRPAHNPLIVHVASIEQAAKLVTHIPDNALKLMQRFCPGPLTVLLPKQDDVPAAVTAGLPNVAIRIPNHPLTLELIQQSGMPLAAPSANPFGYISPTKASHVHSMLKGRVKYILDGDDCVHGIESTIIGFPFGIPTMYRAGAIPVEAIEEVIGEVAIHYGHKALAPGMLPKHYSPHTKLVVVDDVMETIREHRFMRYGVITHNAYIPEIPANRQILLCRDNDFAEAAHNLYAAMHDMDARGYDLIIVKKLPDTGLAAAINDRLYRAAKK